MSKRIEHLKAHIIRGYPDYDAFMESIQEDSAEVAKAKLNARVEEFLRKQTPMSMKIFQYYVQLQDGLLDQEELRSL